MIAGAVRVAVQIAQSFLGRCHCLWRWSPGVFVGGQFDGVADAVFPFQFLQGFAWGIGDDVGYVFWDVEFHYRVARAIFKYFFSNRSGRKKSLKEIILKFTKRGAECRPKKRLQRYSLKPGNRPPPPPS
jgi:hypothetical protein